MSRGATPQASALKRRILRPIFGFIAMSVLFNLVFSEMGIIQGFRQRHTASRLEREVRALETRNAALLTEIDDLRHNPYRIETIARQDLGLCRPGEIIFLFPHGSALAEPPL